MMATSRKVEQPAPGEIEALLPWYAAGTLNARDTRRVEDALAREPDLARQCAVILEEQAETIRLNEDLGAPSLRAMQSLFLAIDAEPERKGPIMSRSGSRISEFFASLSPRSLAWSASIAALVVVAQAGIIGTVLLNEDLKPVQTASYEARNAPRETVTRSMQTPAAPAPAAIGPRASVRFAADARAADIASLLDAYQATVVGSARGGLYRLQFGGRAGATPDPAAIIAQLQNERIVSCAGPAQ